MTGDIPIIKQISRESCQNLQQIFSELIKVNAQNPGSEQTRNMKVRFLEMLANLGLLPLNRSAQDLLSIIEPPWLNTVASKRTSHLMYPRSLEEENKATLWFCSMAGGGYGLVLPPILLPRPRLITQWRGFYPDSSVASVAEMATGRGVIVRGTQIGTAFGFFGVGFAFAVPGAPAQFGFLGYSLLTTLQATDMSWYYANFPPLIMDVSPEDKATNVPLTLPELTFTLKDFDQDPMNYTVVTIPDIGSGADTGVENVEYSIPVSNLESGMTYTWTVSASDGKETIENTFTFTTETVAPLITNPLPAHNAQYVPIWRSNISFDLFDYQGDLMDWTVQTQPDIGSGSGTGVGNGRYTIPISGLENHTKYTWFVNATDNANWARKTYVFTTAPEGMLLLEPSADTFVGEHNPTVNYGSCNHILVSDKYGASSNYDARGMVLFNLSEIPPGSTVVSANFSLYYYHYDDTNPVGREITCHRILEDWDEMTVTYTMMPNSDPVECASTILPGYYTWVSWDVTSEVANLLNGTAQNYGWMIRDYKDPWGSVNIPQQYYYTSNAIDHHPQLLIGYN